MVGKYLRTSALAGLLLLGTAGMAAAEDGAAMTAWKVACSSLISESMHYPWRSVRMSPLKDAHNRVDAVIDRSGRVIEARLAEGSGISAFDRASKRFAQSLTALPALPADFAEDRAVVRMHLVYAKNEETARTLTADILTKVRTERLARAPEGEVRVAGLPVIDLVAGM